MKKYISLCLALVLCGFMLSGCADSGSGSKEEKKPVKIGLLLPGAVNDGGWNAEAYKGLMTLQEECGAEVNYIENVVQSDMQEAMHNYAMDKYDFVIGHGDQFADSALAVAKDFPDTKFILNSATVAAEPNVASCNTINKQQGFLAGVFAAKMSKTGVVGGVASIEIPSLVAFMEGAELGIKYVDESMTFLSAFTGSSTDVGKAKELSKALVNQDADVLLPYASQGDNGVYETAKESGTICVGVISDRYADAPDQIPTSIRCDIGGANVALIKEIINGDAEWEAKVYNMGVPEGIIGYCDRQGKWIDEVPEDVWTYCKSIEKALGDGSLMIDDATLDTIGSVPKI